MHPPWPDTTVDAGPPRPRRHRRAKGTTAVVLVVTLLAGLVAGCSDNDGAAGSGPSTTADIGADTGPTGAAPPDSRYTSLCAALDAALGGDVSAARRAFDHGPLHELADAAIDVDRSVAAHLLEAKEAVESDLGDETTSADQIAQDLRSLIDATTDALTITAPPAPALCEPENQ